MFEYLASFADTLFAGTLGLLLYGFPVAVNAFAYSARTWADVQRDLARQRSGAAWAGEVITVGTVVCRLLLTFVPLLNLLALVFDTAWSTIKWVYLRCEGLLNIPLVRQKQ